MISYPRGVAYRWRPCPLSLSATDHYGSLGACWSALALSLGTRPPSDLDYDLEVLAHKLLRMKVDGRSKSQDC